MAAHISCLLRPYTLQKYYVPKIYTQKIQDDMPQTTAETHLNSSYCVTRDLAHFIIWIPHLNWTSRLNYMQTLGLLC